MPNSGTNSQVRPHRLSSRDVVSSRPTGTGLMVSSLVSRRATTNYDTPGGTNNNSGSSYHYSNQDGSYYYQNDNGSTYYSSPGGHGTYTSPK